MKPAAAAPVPIPDYLARVYTWAYVHPRAVRVFEREWLVNLILFGHYGRLRDAALAALGAPAGGPVTGRTLQVACVYGNLTPKLAGRLTPDARLDVVDVLPVQLANLAAKLARQPGGRPAQVHLQQADARHLPVADGQYDQVLLFFLLHELPADVRSACLAEVLRVVRPGGRVVVVDYDRPVGWHPVRPLMRAIYRWLEPFAMDLWRTRLTEQWPTPAGWRPLSHRRWFGGLYQCLVLQREPAAVTGRRPDRS